MQNFRLKFVLLILISFFSFRANSEALIEQNDKQRHILLSASVTTLSYAYFRSNKYTVFASIMGALAISTFVGTAKELADNHVDNQDLQADAVGTGIGLVLGLVVAW